MVSRARLKNQGCEAARRGDRGLRAEMPEIGRSIMTIAERMIPLARSK